MVGRGCRTRCTILELGNNFSNRSGTSSPNPYLISLKPQRCFPSGKFLANKKEIMLLSAIDTSPTSKPLSHARSLSAPSAAFDIIKSGLMSPREKEKRPRALLLTTQSGQESSPRNIPSCSPQIQTLSFIESMRCTAVDPHRPLPSMNIGLSTIITFYVLQFHISRYPSFPQATMQTGYKCHFRKARYVSLRTSSRFLGKVQGLGVR